MADHGHDPLRDELPGPSAMPDTSCCMSAQWCGTNRYGGQSRQIVHPVKQAGNPRRPLLNRIICPTVVVVFGLVGIINTAPHHPFIPFLSLSPCPPKPLETL